MEDNFEVNLVTIPLSAFGKPFTEIKNNINELRHHFSAYKINFMIDPKEKKIITDFENREATEQIPFKKADNESDEEMSDGSGNAFEETESVNEDNFDDLKEK